MYGVSQRAAVYGACIMIMAHMTVLSSAQPVSLSAQWGC